MMFMLEKNFDGKHCWVKTQDNVALDAMFFPTTSEKVYFRNEFDSKSTIKPIYLRSPTILICNPNALFY
jgi:hypothetical protein